MARKAPGEQLREARDRLADLAENDYPGRMFVNGINKLGTHAVQVYILTGRSTGSRDRAFAPIAGGMRVVAPGKTEQEMAATENANLIYYPAVRERGSLHVVTNGAQTDPILEAVSGGADLERAMRAAPVVDGVDLAKYEPDSPNFTPRISTFFDYRYLSQLPFQYGIVRRDTETGAALHSTEALSLNSIEPGVGYALRTYEHDAPSGQPLPAYEEDTYPLPLGEGITDTAHIIWEVLNSANKVAVVVKSIDLSTGLTDGLVTVRKPVERS